VGASQKKIGKHWLKLTVCLSLLHSFFSIPFLAFA